MADRAGEDKGEMSMGNPIPVMLLDNLVLRGRQGEEQNSSIGETLLNVASLPTLAEPEEAAAPALESSDAAVFDRERLLLEHLSTVRYLARRIHERLPQHVDLMTSSRQA